MRKIILSLCILAAIPAIASASLSSSSLTCASIECKCACDKGKDKGAGEKSSITSPDTFGGSCCPGKGGDKGGSKDGSGSES